MMYLETPPKVIATTIFTAMPNHFRRKGVATGSVLVADISELQ